MKKILLSIAIILVLFNFTFKENRVEAVALVDDVAIASVIAVALLVVGGTALINKNNDNFVKGCNELFEMLDYTTKATIIAMAGTKSYIDNTLNVSKEQLMIVIGGIYSLIQNWNPPISVPAINFATESSTVLSATEVYKWSVACGSIPVTFELSHNLDMTEDIIKIFIANSTPIVLTEPTFFYADKTILTSGITFDGFPHLTISSLESYTLPSGEITFTATQNLDLLTLLPIGQLVGDFTLPDVSISSDVAINQWTSEMDRSISLLLNPTTALFDLPIINSNVDRIFDDVIMGDSLTIFLPDDIAIPTLDDYVASDVAREFDVGTGEDYPPIPYIPSLDWLSELLNYLISLLNMILALLTSIVSSLSSILEAIKFEVSQMNLDLSALKVPLFERFPYCLPWDLLKFLKLFYESPQVPDLNIRFDTKYLKVNHTIDINAITFMIVFFRYVASVWYAVFLIKKTRHFIKW